MAQWCSPGVWPDAGAFPRITALIAQARRDLGGNPSALPFGVEPTDFAEPDCPGWQSFDTVIDAASHSTSAPPSTEPPPRPVVLNPDLWKLRSLPAEVLDELPARRLAAEQAMSVSRDLPTLQPEVAASALQQLRRPLVSAALDTTPVLTGTQALSSTPLLTPTQALSSTPAIDSATLVNAGQSVMASANRSAIAIALRAEPMTAAPSTSAALDRQSRVAIDAAAREILVDDEPPPAPPPRSRLLDSDQARQLVQVDLSDLVGQPAIGTATTTDSSMQVHFEHILLTITRRLAGTPWWHPELVAEPDWYVPGMAAGALVESATDPALAHCLPLSLLLVATSG